MLRSRTPRLVPLLVASALLAGACDSSSAPTAAVATATSHVTTPTVQAAGSGASPAGKNNSAPGIMPAQAAILPIQQASVGSSAAKASSLAVATAKPGLSQKLQISLVARGFGNPDDLAVAPSGDILFGDFSNRAINAIRGGSAPKALTTGLVEPEGIVVAKDGAIIVAEQSTNRIYEIDPRSGTKKVLRQMRNSTGKEGVDGLGLDPTIGDILIPNSPYGTLLRMSRDGTSLQTIASGFVRPTGAAVERSGSIIVVDEFGNAVYRLSTSGKRTLLAHIFQPDDVVIGANGSIYVNSLGGNIDRIDPASGKITVLMSGLKLPMGSVLTRKGTCW